MDNEVYVVFTVGLEDPVAICKTKEKAWEVVYYETEKGNDSWFVTWLLEEYVNG